LTEIVIAVTVYNEDDVLLARTLRGILRNIKHLCEMEDHPFWGKDAWKKIVVCIVGDGRANFDPRSLSLLAALGLYQDGVSVQSVNNEQTQVHIFEAQFQNFLKKLRLTFKAVYDLR
jgi:chitin synthase